ncbi:MAG: PaaI family thioesterase [Dehalococcoidia bacterium]|nr:PaaI family thioesterase [Dehalococcoidia bacterium]
MSKDGDNPTDLSGFREKVEKEPIGTFFGMKLLDLSPGHARVTMKLRPKYLTFNGYVFGGIITSIADQAFACATNSMGRPSIATQFNVHFIAPSVPGDELIAEGKVLRKGRRVDVCEITVTNQDGRLIARATGTAIPMT